MIDFLKKIQLFEVGCPCQRKVSGKYFNVNLLFSALYSNQTQQPDPNI